MSNPNNEIDLDSPEPPLPRLTGGAQLPAVVPQSQERQMLARWISADDDIVTNLPVSDPDYEYLLLTTAGEADKKTRNAAGSRLRLVGFAVSIIQLTDKETGEVFMRERAVLLGEDGGTVSTTSISVLRSLRVLARSRGPGRWTPAVEVEIAERPLGDGESYCVMKVARSVPSAQPKKK